MKNDSYPWFEKLEDLKADLDLELGQVGEIRDDAIQYRMRDGSFFRSFFEESGGKYRLTGAVHHVTLTRRRRSR